MRLWSIHPKYLDYKGLLAVWREGLLAQKVLKGHTTGYKNHPQLKRFKQRSSPRKTIANYLLEIWKESDRRGYHFDKKKIGKTGKIGKIPVKNGQLEYEFDWLCKKLETRDKVRCGEIKNTVRIECNPIFKVIEGGVEEWEKLDTKKSSNS
jgi:hypothetical protein